MLAIEAIHGVRDSEPWASYAAPRLILKDRIKNHDAYDNDNDCTTANDGTMSMVMPAFPSISCGCS